MYVQSTTEYKLRMVTNHSLRLEAEYLPLPNFLGIHLNYNYPIKKYVVMLFLSRNPNVYLSLLLRLSFHPHRTGISRCTIA